MFLKLHANSCVILLMFMLLLLKRISEIAVQMTTIGKQNMSANEME